MISFQLYQFIVAIIAGLMIIQGAKKYFSRGEHQSFLKFFVRVIVWGGMAVVALFPSVSNKLATAIGLEGNINAVILTGFLLVFLMMFKILSIIEKIEHDITVITRKEAIRKSLHKNE